MNNYLDWWRCNNDADIPESGGRTRKHRSDTGNVDIVLLSTFGVFLLDPRAMCNNHIISEDETCCNVSAFRIGRRFELCN
jgi:hypothetical protein